MGHCFKLTDKLNGFYFYGSRISDANPELSERDYSDTIRERMKTETFEFIKEIVYEGPDHLAYANSKTDFTDPKCLNLKAGIKLGSTFTVAHNPNRRQSEAHKAKLSASRKGKKRSGEALENMRKGQQARRVREKEIGKSTIL